MKKLLLLLLLLSLTSRSFSQLYGNEWINFNQTYFRFKIITDGLYRINYSTLQNFGVPVNSINGNTVQIFNKGKEVPVYVTTNGIFGTNDYIEFYGVHNDGWWDSCLYADPTWQANERLSLFNDTASYYLTWGTQASLNHFTNYPNDISNAPPKESFCWSTTSYLFGTQKSSYYMSHGQDALPPNYMFNSDYSATEGYTDHNWFNKTSYDYIISTPHAYTAGPPGQFKSQWIGWGICEHDMEISVNGNLIYSSTYSDYTSQKADVPISSSAWLTIPTTTLTYSSANSISPTTDWTSVAWIDFKYPRELDFDNVTSVLFGLPASSADQYIEVGNFNEAGTIPLLYDFTNKLRLESIVQNDTNKFLLPPSPNAERQLLLIAHDLSLIRSVDSLFPVHFVNYSLTANQGDFIIISHPLFFKDSLGHNYVEDYRVWKNSTGFTSIIADINDLYDQFAYGIRQHPASINKFAEYILNHWPQQEENRYFFLVGKGIEAPVYNDQPWQRSYCYVPTFGHPGSDVLLSAFGYSPKPLLPVGRIPALTPEDVKIYLKKAQQFVNAQDISVPAISQTVAHSAWMKRVIHLAGGSNASDQAYFLNFLGNYERIIEDTLFGGVVSTFSKDSPEPIELATNEELDALISGGVSLITFFGHSSYQSFDFNLDRPELYENEGKYPLILTNGCLIGNLFTYYHGLADDFIFAEDRGAIGFLGPSIFSIATSLDLYTYNFYQNLSYTDYNKPVGDVIQSTLQDVVTYSGADIDRALAEQMLFAGDPALVLNTHGKPDYDLELQNVSFDPPSISAGIDSFYLQIVTYNLGKAIDDSIYVDVNRTLPDGTTEYLYHKKIPAPYYTDTLRLVIKTNAASSLGLNQFYIKVDAGDTTSLNGDVDEISELNNTLNNISLVINADDLVPVWPYDYSIVSSQGVTLKASTANAFALSKQYVIQIDTTQLFNSPLLQTKKITQPGGVVHWTPTLTMIDSTVYYWRTSLDTLYGFDFAWHNSSFIYLPGSSPGWNQSHYFQLTSSIQGNGNIELPSSTRAFKYADDVKTLGMFNGMTTYVNGNLSWDAPGFYLNGVLMGRWDCGLGSNCLLGWIDAGTGSFVLNSPSPGNYGPTNCKTYERPQYFYNMYNYDHNDDLLNFFDTVPDGDYIMFMSMNDARLYAWDSTMKAALTDLGLSQFNTITSAVPYVFFVKKNDPTYAPQEVVGDTFTSLIDTSFSFIGKWTDGYIESPLVGPASEWTSLHWKAHSIEPGFDSVSLQVIGVNDDGIETTLISNVLASDTNIAGIDVNIYPYLKLRLNCVDTTYRTPIQLDYWRINYQPVPEAALNPAAHFSIGDTVNQFLPMKLVCAVENLTPYDMDSLLMEYVITDATNVQHTFSKRYAPLSGNDTLHIQYLFETGIDSYAGLNYLFIEANPDDDQPEQTHFNNIGLVTFSVMADNLNPILDVTFDGIHILDGDIVSAKPEIDIMLKDENKFVPMNDTSQFDIFLIYPDGTEHTVVFDNLTAFFYPADSTNLAKDNTARVMLKREFLTDGEYQLIVQGYDRGGNASGENEYRISFKVINKPMISNVLNYPNPFSTSTRFVFTLTGYEIPQQVKITVYTITGKVIREIFLSEMGNIHIGNNITEFAWDGRDQYGDKLANGLYFYKVEAMLNGKDMDHYDNGTDGYFKKGIGKMYLMR